FAAIVLIVIVRVTEIGPVYCADDVVGVLPSVVKKIVAPLVASLSGTDCGRLYIPAARPNAGVATCSVYVALATALPAVPPFTSIALIVVVWLTVIGPA